MSSSIVTFPIRVEVRGRVHYCYLPRFTILHFGNHLRVILFGPHSLQPHHNDHCGRLRDARVRVSSEQREGYLLLAHTPVMHATLPWVHYGPACPPPHLPPFGPVYGTHTPVMHAPLPCVPCGLSCPRHIYLLLAQCTTCCAELE